MASVEDVDAASTMNILISTDNHLGYLEKDPIRGDDSFRAFEETLILANKLKVDFLLLGGDLFHDNKPSRRTLHRCIDLLREHCMGDRGVHFEIVSDQTMNFRTTQYGRVNYEDPNYNIQLPIFGIHGNHDDPTREGAGAGTTEALSAMDLLSVSNLVNYIGKSSSVDRVDLLPVLMTKGETKIALYGLGSIRDERLNRLFTKSAVNFVRPVIPEGEEGDWFSIFTLHQNRGERGRGAKNCVHEAMIPSFMDYVVWGHEHECIKSSEESVIGQFHVVQPGSSVATSLSEGESKRKHVALLQVNGDRHMTRWFKLRNVRPFVMDEICLATHVDEHGNGLDPDGVNLDTKIDKVLRAKVATMIATANAMTEEERAEDQEREQGSGDEPALPLKAGMDLPLIRLRVDHRGFPVLNNQRFGQNFMSKVANPNDILAFHRKAQKASNQGGASKRGAGSSSAAVLDRPVRPEALQEVSINDLVYQQLEDAPKPLTLLNQPELQRAVSDYVEKQQAQAIKDFVDTALEDLQRKLRKEKDTSDASDMQKFCLGQAEKARVSHRMRMEELQAKKDEEALKLNQQKHKAREEQERRRDAARGSESDEDDDMPPPARASAALSSDEDAPSAKKPAARRGRGRGAEVVNLDSDEEDEAEDDGDSDSGRGAKAKKKAPKKKPAAKKPAKKPAARPTRGRAKVAYKEDSDVTSDEEEDSDDEVVTIEDDSDASDFEPEPKKTARGSRKRAAPPSTATAAKASRTTGRGKARVSRRSDSDDDEVEEIVHNSQASSVANWGRARSRKRT